MNKPRVKVYALVTASETACLETALYGADYNAKERAKVEKQFCKGGWDDPVPNTWLDVTENDAFILTDEAL